jgi:FlaA1/EpsC-like NDP-sugar epimerase
MIGGTRLSSLYIKMLETYFPGQHQVIGVLDAKPQMHGRTMAGVRVLGSPQDLRQIVDEFTVHGIHATRIIVGGDDDFLPDAVLQDQTGL